MLLAVLLPAAAQATSLTVPDDVATIQAALDAGVDTVFIRAGTYAETPSVSAKVVLLGMEGSPGSVRPTLSGLLFDGAYRLQGSLAVRNVDFTGQVRIMRSGTDCSSTFSDCEFLGGILEYSSPATAPLVSLLRCRIVGVAELSPRGDLVVDSCVVDGRLLVPRQGTHLRATGSEFHGNGSGVGIGATEWSEWYGFDASLDHCLIEGYDTGIEVRGRLALSLSVVRDCGAGIVVDGGASIGHNRVERIAGNGIWVRGTLLVDVSGNTVARCGGTGITAISRSWLDVRDNVVHGSGRDGIHVVASDLHGFEVSYNTSALNAGCGFVSECVSPDGYSTFSNNIGTRNGVHGVRWVGPTVTDSRCNVWFANALGDVEGLLPSPMDQFVDPLFCDPENGDFRLSDTSPLLGTECNGSRRVRGSCPAPGVQGDAFRLSRSGPNPFTGSLEIVFEMPRDAMIEVEVFDVLGRRVATPASGNWPAGRHTVEWSPRSGGAGVYLVRYRFPGGEERRRLVRTP